MGALFLVLLNRSIAAGWLIFSVIILRLLMKRSPKWIRYILWAMVAVRLVFPLSLESVFSLIPSAETIPVQGIYSGNSIAANAPYHIQLKSGIQTIDRVVQTTAFETTGSAIRSGIQIFAWIWLAGVILFLLYAIIGYLRMGRIVREAVLLRDNIWLCDAVKSPFIISTLRPRIYLPSGISEGQANYVLVHERVHLKHRDHWWKPMGYLLLAVYWFNPLVWAAYLLFCRDVELACDETVIQNMKTEEKKAYSHVLLACGLQRKMVMAYPLSFGEVGVKERINTVLNHKKPALWTIVVAVAVCAVVAVCFLTNPKGQGEPIEPPLEETDDSGYDELIAQARDVIEHFDGDYPEEMPFSSVFYQNWDYETLGYLIRDIDGNGVDELIFGANTDGWDNGSWDGVVYNIYTIVNGEIVRVLDGWERNRYYLCENGCIANEGSSSAAESSYRYYTYRGTELTLVESVLYYSWEDEAHPWFFSTETEPDMKNAEPISQEKATEIMSKYVHEHPQYTPFVG